MADLRVATVLFTDLVGSTEFSTQLGPDAAEAVRQTQFALLRGAIADHGGVEVKNLGDGLMVAFSTTSGALACAVAMQQALERHNRTTPNPLSVRIGIAHGEVTEENGDYFGDPVVEAARLCAEAEGGRVLATQLVQLTSGRRAVQEFGPPADIVLKGFEEPVTVVDVLWSPEEDAGRASPVPLPTRCAVVPDAGFVGRDGQKTVLSDALKLATVEGSRRIVFIGGEPGMGKTSLSTDFSRGAHSSGAIVLYGRADEDLGVPYQPWVEAISHLVSHAPPEVLAVVRQHARSLVQLAPDLAGQVDGSAATTSDQEAARFLLFGSVVSALRAASELAPVVVVLDDLQWADAPSLQLLRHIATTTEPLHLLVIATFRESEVEAAGQLAEVLAACHREQGIERLSLRGLDDTELLALMESASGQRMTEDGVALRDALLTETDGNPFFVGELLRHLVEARSIYQQEGRWVVSGDLRENGLPVSVREVIGRRTARLGDEGARVLSIASVIGRDFDLSLLAETSDIDAGALLDLLDAAIDAVLVTNVAGERYSFVHALIEHTLYDSLTPARRAYLHRQVAEAMEAQDRNKDQPRVAELAYHWAEATIPENRDKAIDYACRAGDVALAKLAPEEAARWYRAALEELENHGDAHDGEVRCRVLVGLGTAQRQMGDQSFGRTLLDAAHLAQRLGDTDLLVRAALANSRGFVSVVGIVDDERVAVLEAACKALAGTRTAGEARLLALLGSELVYGNDFPRRKELASRAIAIAREVDDPATFIQVVCDATQATHVPETFEERAGLIEEAFSLALQLGDPVLQFLSANFQSAYFLEHPDFVARGREAANAAHEIAEVLGQPGLRWISAFTRADIALQLGDLETAEDFAEQASQIAADMNEPDGPLMYGAQLMSIRQKQGRVEEIIPLVRQIAEQYPGIPAFWSALAWMLHDAGDLEGARAVLEELGPERIAQMPYDNIWLASQMNAAPVVAALRWHDIAARLYANLEPYREQLFYTGVNCGPQANYALGLLADALGRHDDAERAFAEAHQAHEAMGARGFLAMTDVAWGAFLARRGAPADGERARILISSALSASEAHGYGWVERQARTALATLTG